MKNGHDEAAMVHDLIGQVAGELGVARATHGPMRGPHEGWAVIFEELDELWDEVRAKKQNPVAMRKEALQVAAMALRFILDVCPLDHPFQPCLAGRWCDSADVCHHEYSPGRPCHQRPAAHPVAAPAAASAQA